VKKAPALITLGIIASTVALTFYLSLRSEEKKLDPWQLVSPASAGVLETSRPHGMLKLRTDTSKLLDLIIAAGSKGKFIDPYLFSFQSIGKELGWVAILPRNFPSLLDTLSKLKVQVRNRSYEGKTLHDLYRGDVYWASLAQIEGIWTASRHAILVESTIRQNQVRDDNFRKKNFRLFVLPAVKQDDGNYYLGNPSLVQRKPATIPLTLSHSMILDFRWSDRSLMANGFALDTADAPTLLSLFNDQHPVSLDLRKVLPDDLQSVVHFGFSDPKGWFQNREATRTTLGQRESPGIDAYGFDLEVFASAVDNEMLYCRLSGGDEIVLIELKEITKALGQLDKIRSKLSQENLYSRDKYADRTIHTLKKADVLAPIFWPIKLSTPEASYAVDGNVLLIAPQSKTIESFIGFTDTERTTGKSVTWQRFFETTLVESNVSFLISNPSADFSGALIGLPMLSPIEKFSFQFYSLEGNHYASGTVQFAGPGQQKKPTDTRVTFSGLSLLKPALVQNYVERKNEILVQDSDNNLQLVDANGKPRWVAAIKDRITTETGQVDYLKNGKVQFLFCTSGKIHLIDRLGKYVPGFPREISMKSPRWLSVIDYDKSRNYRWMIADDDGNILLLDKDGKVLPGWSPKPLGRPFADAPDFYRIQGRDYFLAVTVDGDIHLFNRRGETVSGFPVNTRIIPGGQIACDGELISMVSQDGLLVKYDTQGKRVFEEPLLKNVKEATFIMSVDKQTQAFVVARTERGNLAFFDSSGGQKFEVVNPLSDKIEVQFIQATREKSLIAVRDIDQGLLFTLDMAGRLLIKQPVQATQTPAIDYERESSVVRMFIVNDDRIEILKLPF
jgi:hypothetical protein